MVRTKEFRKLVLILVSFMIFMTTACGKNEKVKEETSSDCVLFSDFFFAGNGAMTENYVIYCHNNRYGIFDAKTGLDMPYCFEPNCTHKPPVWDITGKLLQDGCPAYKFSGPLCLRGANTVWFTGTELIQGDREGKNRKTIAKLDIPQGLMWEKLYTDKDFFFAYSLSDEYTKEKDKNGNEYWLLGEPLEKPENGIYRISLETGEQQYVCRFWEYDAHIRELFVYNNHLYYALTYFTKPYIMFDPEAGDDWNACLEKNSKNVVIKWYSYDIASGETICLAERKENLMDSFFGNGFFCVYDNGNAKAEWFDLTGRKIRDKNIAIASHAVYAKDNIAIYQVKNEENPKEHIFEMYDVANDKVLRHVKGEGSHGNISSLFTVVDNNYYVWVSFSDGAVHEAWISGDDFWSGAWDKAVLIGGKE